jgi:hypothetical protein
MTTPDDHADFLGWTRQQAAAIRARDWAAVDVTHVAEEIEDLWKAADHDLTMLVLGFLEPVYRPCPQEEGQYYWQSAVIDHHRAMLEKMLEGSPRDALDGIETPDKGEASDGKDTLQGPRHPGREESPWNAPTSFGTTFTKPPGSPWACSCP